MNQQQIKEIKKWMLENDRWKNAKWAGFLIESNLSDYFFKEKAQYINENNVRRQDVWAAAEQVIDELVRDGIVNRPAHWR